jgi:hypothetical protein
VKNETLSSKYPEPRGMAEAEECLSSKYEVLNSKPSTSKKKQKKIHTHKSRV